MGQELARRIDAPGIIITIAKLQRDNSSLIVNGKVGTACCAVTVDTGASRSVIRPDYVKTKWLRNMNRYILKTATGEKVEVLGEILIDIDLAGIKFTHKFLVADITDECIIGLDFMTAHKIQLDIGERVMKYNNIDIPMALGSTLHSALKVVVCEDIELPACAESIIHAKVNGDIGSYRFYLVEPDNNQHNKNLIIGKCLVNVNEKKEVPIRIMNVSNQRIKLKEGVVLGNGAPAEQIISIEGGSLNKVSSPGRNHSELINAMLPSGSLSVQEYNEGKSLVEEFAYIFAQNDDDFGKTSLVQHRIDTTGAQPIRQPPRRLPLAKQEEVTKMIETMHDQGIIEESKSPWMSPVVLVKKKDGSTRFCVDYRRLNEVTKKDSYPLPRIDDTLDTLSGSKWFSTLDLKSGYWQVEIHPDDKEKTAFSVGTGLWQFSVMPFGLCNAPATFERLMECVLRGLTWKTCLVYLDDIIVIGRTFEEHLKNLRDVFQKLSSAGLKLSPKKCALFRDRVNYLGHVVSPEGVSTDPEKIAAVKNWPTPQDKHQLRSFLGLATYYRRFVRNFADVAKSLHQLTEKGRPFIWTDKCDKSFEVLKQELCNAPILTFPEKGKTFILDTDASNVGIGAVLSQEVDGQEKVVAYYSRALAKPERNYCVTRRELLAIVESTKHFHKYLYGQKFVLRTDHAALKWLMQFKHPEGQVARWIERLQAYDFEIVHRKGRNHGNADALSRRPCPPECKHCTKAEEKGEHESLKRTTVEPMFGWDEQELRDSQREDPDVSPILAWKEFEERPEWKDLADRNETVKSYWAQWNSLHVERGILKRKWEAADGSSYRMQVVVPKAKVTEVLEKFHKGASGGHLGINKTLSKIKERFYWLRMREDVEDWCRKCTLCAASKGPQRKSRGTLHQYNVRAPFKRIAINVAGPFPESDHGTPITEGSTPEEYVSDLRERLMAIHDVARKNLKMATERMKTRYDLRANCNGFQEGDLVWLYNPQRRKGKSPKLQQQWEGPYNIVTRINDVVYRIQRRPTARMKVVHLDRLCRYQRPDPGATAVRDEQS